MIVLGIHDGHNSGCSIFKNGKLICALSEERVTRKKNEYGFPFNAINFCLKFSKVKKNQIDQIAVSTKKLPPKYFLVKRNTTFKLEDYFKEQNEYWYKKIYLNKKVKYLDIFHNRKVKKKNLYYDFRKVKNEDDSTGLLHARRDYFSNFFSLDKSKIHFFDHHECHAYYGYYGSRNLSNKVCVVTLDGGGDGSNATIWKSKDGKLEEVYRSNIGNLGRMYRYITLSLGMKPTEHEFKVMGLAGYGLDNDAYYKKILNIFRETLNVSGIKFKYKKKTQR